MIETENKIFIQFAVMAERLIEEGAEHLVEYLSMGDWTLLVVNRGYLAEMDLTDEEQLELERLDAGLANIFTHELLKAYAVMDEDVRVWWG